MNRNPPKVAFVDDEEDLLDLYRIQTTQDCSIETFSHPQQALDSILAQRDFDVIVSDFRMPDIDGIELLNALRGKECEVPFVIATGFADKSLAVEALKRGAFALIEKPIEQADLFVVIQRAAAFQRLSLHCQKALSFYDQLFEKMDSPEKVISILNKIRPYVHQLAQERRELTRLASVLRKV